MTPAHSTRRRFAKPRGPRLSEAERDARLAADREFVQQAVEALRSSDRWQRWLATRRHFHTYSLRNKLLIALQKPDATRVAGFKAWLAFGYCVRRGERGLRIFAPCPPSTAKLDAWRKSGADPTEKPRTFFRLTAVYDTYLAICSVGCRGCGSAVADARQPAPRRSHGGAGEEPGGRRAVPPFGRSFEPGDSSPAAAARRVPRRCPHPSVGAWGAA